MKRRAREAIAERLRETGLWPEGPGTYAGPAAGHALPDRRWYWVSLAILDRPYGGIRGWMKSGRGWREALGESEDDKALRRHVDRFVEAVEGALDEGLGRPPDDLLDVLTELALAGPAVCAARALRRIAPGLRPSDRDLLHAAAQVASGLRTLFNLPQTIGLLRGSDPEAYWREVLHHSLDGNLQAVLDEYAHQLRESLGVADHAEGEAVDAVAKEMAEALSFRTAPVAADELKVGPSGRLRFERFRFRSRFALRFADLRDDRDERVARAGTVRTAFNSPFRPFVLATTSIGQEGLDFHPYCHAVWHWNLPSNPVDLEQREGRVQRYKGHAVRKNVALRWGLGAVRERGGGAASSDGAGAEMGAGLAPDPWEVLFRVAADARPAGASDLVPYWIYPLEGGAHVERRVPLFPLSREAGHLGRLRKGLAVYRLAFGQPRQEDLVEFLAEQADGGSGGPSQDLRVSLEPPVMHDRHLWPGRTP